MFNFSIVEHQFPSPKETVIAIMVLKTYPQLLPYNNKIYTYTMKRLYPALTKSWDYRPFFIKRVSPSFNIEYISFKNNHIIYSLRFKKGAPVNDVAPEGLKLPNIGNVYSYLQAVKLINPIQRLRYIYGLDKFISIPEDLLETQQPKLTKLHKGRIYFPYEQKLEKQKWQDGQKQNHRGHLETSHV